MSLRLIGQIIDNSKLVGYLYVDSSVVPNVGKMTSVDELQMAMKNGLQIDNAQLSNNDTIVGTEGSLTRLTKFSPNWGLLDKDRITIIGVILNNGVLTDKYKVLSPLKGERILNKKSLIQEICLNGATNATVQSRATGYSLRSLNGEFKRIEENIVTPRVHYARHEEEAVRTGKEKNKRTAKSIIGRTRPYRVRLNVVSLDYNFRGTFGRPYQALDDYRITQEIDLLECKEKGYSAPGVSSRYTGNVNNGYNSLLNIYSYLLPDDGLNNLALTYYLARKKKLDLQRKFNSMNAEYKELKATTVEELQQRKDDGEYLANYQFNFMVGQRNLRYYVRKLTCLKEKIEKYEEVLNNKALETYANCLPISYKEYASKGKLSYVLFNLKHDPDVASKFTSISSVTANINFLFAYYSAKDILYSVVAYARDMQVLCNDKSYLNYGLELRQSRRIVNFVKVYSNLENFRHVHELVSNARLRNPYNEVLYSMLSTDERFVFDTLFSGNI